MILIESVNTRRIDGDREVVIRKIQESVSSCWEIGDTPQHLKYLDEIVMGKHFRNSEGEDIVVGWSADVGNELTFPLDVLDRQSTRIDELLLKNKTYKLWADSHAEKLFYIEHATFWQRLKWLFTGVKFGD